MSEVFLLVEDNPADVMVVREALHKIDPTLRVELITDGQAALDYLSGKPPYHQREQFPLPDLILLDLSLPKLDGFHVLEWVRTEPNFRSLPVVILATSSAYPDIQQAYSFGASSFITKPQDLGKLVRDLQLALNHWLYKSGTDSCTPEPPALRDAA